MQNIRYIYRHSTQDITKKDSRTSGFRCRVESLNTKKNVGWRDG